jgi:hypothetical protein
MANTGAGSSSPFGSFGRRLDEQFGEVEGEIRKVIAYLNDEVVPQVRRNSSAALRTASEQLGKLAEHLDRNQTRPGA